MKTNLLFPCIYFSLLQLLFFSCNKDDKNNSPIDDMPKVKNITYLTNGGVVHYSPIAKKIAYERYNTFAGSLGADGSPTAQVWIADANGQNPTCMTCTDIPNGPLKNRHKGMPTWHSSGNWLVIAVEMPNHTAQHAQVRPGAGLYHDLWAVKSDFSKWVKLTSYLNNATTSPFARPAGALVPRFSRTGDKLVWAEMLDYNPAKPFGKWQLVVADFTNWNTDTPSLSNLSYFKPNNGEFYEAWTFSPDNQTITVASDAGVAQHGELDFFLWNVGSNTMKNMTNSNQYEEQAVISPDGKYIAYMSSENINPPYNPANFIGTIRTEVWLMKIDGTNKRKITHFNVVGSPEYFDTGVSQKLGIPTSWGEDSKTLYVAVGVRQPGINNLGNDLARLYKIEFE
jgi:hypothetical protein